MDFVAMVDELRSEGYSPDEINSQIIRAMEEEHEAFMEAYEDDPLVQDGWHQQDIIDMYRRER